MSLVAWMVLGAIAGVLFSVVAYRRWTAGVGGLFLGAFGGFVGGFVFNVTALRNAAQWSSWSLVAAAAGALLMMGGFHVLRRTGHGA